MRLLSVYFFVCVSLFVSSLATDYKWYVIYASCENTGIVYLDSNNGNIELSTKFRNDDKGIRFRYSTVTGFLTSQAHNKKFVGLEENEFKANIDDDKDNHDRLVRVTFYEVKEGEWEVSLCLNFATGKPIDCIGPGALRRTKEFRWKFGEIPEAS